MGKYNLYYYVILKFYAILLRDYFIRFSRTKIIEYVM